MAWDFAEYQRVRHPGPVGIVGQMPMFTPEPLSSECACGGLITADVEDRIPLRVRAHVLSEPHLSWSRSTYPERHR